MSQGFSNGISSQDDGVGRAMSEYQAIDAAKKARKEIEELKRELIAQRSQLREIAREIDAIRLWIAKQDIEK